MDPSDLGNPPNCYPHSQAADSCVDTDNDPNKASGHGANQETPCGSTAKHQAALSLVASLTAVSDNDPRMDSLDNSSSSLMSDQYSGLGEEADDETDECDSSAWFRNRKKVFVYRPLYRDLMQEQDSSDEEVGAAQRETTVRRKCKRPRKVIHEEDPNLRHWFMHMVQSVSASTGNLLSTFPVDGADRHGSEYHAQKDENKPGTPMRIAPSTTVGEELESSSDSNNSGIDQTQNARHKQDSKKGKPTGLSANTRKENSKKAKNKNRSCHCVFLTATVSLHNDNTKKEHLESTLRRGDYNEVTDKPGLDSDACDQEDIDDFHGIFRHCKTIAETRSNGESEGQHFDVAQKLAILPATNQNHSDQQHSAGEKQPKMTISRKVAHKSKGSKSISTFRCGKSDANKSNNGPKPVCQMIHKSIVNNRERNIPEQNLVLDLGASFGKKPRLTNIAKKEHLSNRHKDEQTTKRLKPKRTSNRFGKRVQISIEEDQSEVKKTMTFCKSPEANTALKTANNLGFWSGTWNQDHASTQLYDLHVNYRSMCFKNKINQQQKQQIKISSKSGPRLHKPTVNQHLPQAEYNKTETAACELKLSPGKDSENTCKPLINMNKWKDPKHGADEFQPLPPLTNPGNTVKLYRIGSLSSGLSSLKGESGVGHKRSFRLLSKRMRLISCEEKSNRLREKNTQIQLFPPKSETLEYPAETKSSTSALSCNGQVGYSEVKKQTKRNTGDDFCLQFVSEAQRRDVNRSILFDKEFTKDRETNFVCKGQTKHAALSRQPSETADEIGQTRFLREDNHFIKINNLSENLAQDGNNDFKQQTKVNVMVDQEATNGGLGSHVFKKQTGCSLLLGHRRQAVNEHGQTIKYDSSLQEPKTHKIEKTYYDIRRGQGDCKHDFIRSNDSNHPGLNELKQDWSNSSDQDVICQITGIGNVTALNNQQVAIELRDESDWKFSREKQAEVSSHMQLDESLSQTQPHRDVIVQSLDDSELYQRHASDQNRYIFSDMFMKDKSIDSIMPPKRNNSWPNKDLTVRLEKTVLEKNPALDNTKLVLPTLDNKIHKQLNSRSSCLLSAIESREQVVKETDSKDLCKNIQLGRESQLGEQRQTTGKETGLPVMPGRQQSCRFEYRSQMQQSTDEQDWQKSDALGQSHKRQRGHIQRQNDILVSDTLLIQGCQSYIGKDGTTSKTHHEWTFGTERKNQPGSCCHKDFPPVKLRSMEDSSLVLQDRSVRPLQVTLRSAAGTGKMDRTKLLTDNQNNKNQKKTNDDSLTAEKKSSYPLTSEKMCRDPLTSEAMFKGPLTSEKMPNNSLSSENMFRESLTSKNLSSDDPSTSEKMSHNPLTLEKMSSDPLTTKQLTSNDSLTSEKMSRDLFTSEKMPSDILTREKMSNNDSLIPEKMLDSNLFSDLLASKKISSDVLKSEKMSNDPLTSETVSSDPLASGKMSSDPLASEKMFSDHLISDNLHRDPSTSEKMPSDPLTSEKMPTGLPCQRREVCFNKPRRVPLANRPVGSKRQIGVNSRSSTSSRAIQWEKHILEDGVVWYKHACAETGESGTNPDGTAFKSAIKTETCLQSCHVEGNNNPNRSSQGGHGNEETVEESVKTVLRFVIATIISEQ